MKRAIFEKFGRPENVIKVIEEPDPLPGYGQVRVRNYVMTINPADILLIEGRYGAEPIALPATPGVGAWGVVDAIGEGVTRLAIGDAVLPVGGGLWSDTVIVDEQMAPKAPIGVDPEQAAMMRANPSTAYLMLRDIVSLKPGDWIVQNASNSSVGLMVIRFAKEMGLRTINIVRRADVVQKLEEEGADVVIVDDGTQDLALAIRALLAVPPKLAFDAVGGTATRALAASVAEGGTVVVYGLLSGEENSIAVRDLVFRGIIVRGFWLADWFRTATNDRLKDLNTFLAKNLAMGFLQTEVEKRYPLSKVSEAVTHAGQANRFGKIILTGEHNA